MSDDRFQQLRDDAWYEMAQRQFDDRKGQWLVIGAVCGALTTLLAGIIASLLSGSPPC